MVQPASLPSQPTLLQERPHALIDAAVAERVSIIFCFQLSTVKISNYVLWFAPTLLQERPHALINTELQAAGRFEVRPYRRQVGGSAGGGHRGGVACTVVVWERGSGLCVYVRERERGGGVCRDSAYSKPAPRATSPSQLTQRRGEAQTHMHNTSSAGRRLPQRRGGAQRHRPPARALEQRAPLFGGV